LFNPPAGLSQFGYFVWLTVFAMLVRGALTFYNVPHLALGAEMARDYAQRSTLFAFSQLFGSLGRRVGGLRGVPLLLPDDAGVQPGPAQSRRLRELRADLRRGDDPGDPRLLPGHLPGDPASAPAAGR
jgi:hypothetical protein